MHNHGFYLMLAYGLGAAALALEALLLWRRSRRARAAARAGELP